MATLPIDAVPIAAVVRPDVFLSAACARLEEMLLNRHSPYEIAEAIDMLDLLAGGSDAEHVSDEQDGALAEDEPCASMGRAALLPTRAAVSMMSAKWGPLA